MKKMLYGLAVICSLFGLIFFSSCPPKSETEPYKEIRLLMPEDGAISVSTTAEMTWELRLQKGSNFYEYDVYIGTNKPPATMVATRLSLPSFYPTLLANTTYYWSVIGKDYSNDDTVDSEVWQFTTEK